MSDVESDDILKSADHWDSLAADYERRAARDRELGICLSEPGQGPGDHMARSARRCADTLRAEARTGVRHCMCHMLPVEQLGDAEQCPLGATASGTRF